MLRNYVRAPARDLGQALRQGRALAEEVRAPREVDEEVYVAVGAFLAASDGTSHALASSQAFGEECRHQCIHAHAFLPGASGQARVHALYQLMPALKWLRLLLNHVPDKYEHLVRCYGYYSNRARGARRLAAQEHDTSASIPIDEPPWIEASTGAKSGMPRRYARSNRASVCEVPIEA